MNKLSEKRFDELNALRVEKGLRSIISLLEVDELELYLNHIEEMKQRATSYMKKYEDKNNVMFTIHKDWLDGLNELSIEVMERISREAASLQSVGL